LAEVCIHSGLKYCFIVHDLLPINVLVLTEISFRLLIDMGRAVPLAVMLVFCLYLLW